MRTRASWYRILMLCLFSGILLGLLNILLWVPQTVPCPPCECDCFSELEKLKTHYEKEIARLRVLKIDAHEPSTDVGISQNSSRGSDVSKEAFNASLTASHRLAVLVPFRNRFEEMLEFVPHIHQFLNRQSVEHEVWIMNQADTHRKSCDYMVMHDVDLLPLNDNLQYKYPSDGPYHISAPSLHPLYHYKTFVGGILSLSREQFERVNGLSNLFWGWGREDDELYLRMKEAGMKVQYPQGITTGKDTFKHIHDKAKRPRDQKKYFNQWTVSRQRDRKTGLDTLKYSILSHHNMTLNGAPFHFVDVELKCDYDATPFCDEPPKDGES